MLFFGPISSLFDFVTFALMIHVFNAGPPLFRSGWFVESLATQTLVIFVVRTRAVPFFRSRPSAALTAAALAVVLVGIALPYLPVATKLGFAPLPAGFLAALVVLVATYLTIVEFTKRRFFTGASTDADRRSSRTRRIRRIHRRAARYSHGAPLEPRSS
jgi:Mg2+-importing ATPase